MTPAFERHIDEEDLERYSLGTLPEPETESLEEHLLVCPLCQSRLEELDDYVKASRGAARRLLAEPPSARERWREGVVGYLLQNRAAAALTAVAIILVVVIASPWRPGSSGTLAPATVMLSAARGVENSPAATGPAQSPFRLEIDLREVERLPAYRVEIAASDGASLWTGEIPAGQEHAMVTVPKGFAAGRYWVRLYNPREASLLREFGLTLR